MRHLLVFFLIVLAFSGCASRGTLNYDLTGTTNIEALGAGGPSVRKIFVATSRQIGESSEQPFSGQRSNELTYQKYGISVPPVHQPGEIEWPVGKPDPLKHFVVRSVNNFTEDGSFLSGINQALAETPQAHSSINIFIHGYNNNFAEGLYRYAQMLHDYDAAEVAIHYSWPSAASVGGYVYDRDSSIFARDGLAELLEMVAKSDAKEIRIAAHSLGTLLTMEVMRQLSIAGNGSLNGKLSGLFLMSPDIDEDVFITQARRLDPVPQPFVVFTSSEDTALKFSSLLTGGQPRLGSIQNAERLDALGVTLIDLSAASDGDSLHHASAITSPLAISLIRSLRKEVTQNPLEPLDRLAGGILKLTKDTTGALVLAGQD
ncbi:MAG: alpha/beta hydrolase [Pseudomonadota bacterium]